jgi:predicted enzyme related to lactoylglutathione lyase
MVDDHGRFAWYELMTTDVAAARAFYAEVVGWGTQDASTSELAYTLFTSADTRVCGLLDLPADARKMGATPRWMGYVAVDDVDSMVRRFKRLGGAIYVPPTNTNIGRISVVADPQTASLALASGMRTGQRQAAGLDAPGQVSWHELLATDWKKAFAFYSELFGWREADADGGSADTYQLFSAGGRTIGGMFTRPAVVRVPFWLYYFSVDDIGAAAKRVRAGGGQIFVGPVELPDGSWIARCTDPQGAMFALQGKQNSDRVERSAGSEVAWSSAWGGFSSRGRMRVKPRS